MKLILLKNSYNKKNILKFNKKNMWRGPVVQARKDAVNREKWKIFAVHAKLIALAAQNGWDIDSNPRLAAAVEKAKKAWVPNDNISRAIKKWTWEDKSAAQIQEITYEWYAPGWVAIIVKTLTDNKNRTASNIKHIFSKYGWNMWEPWAVSWMFKRKWVILIDSEKYNYENIEELVFETDAQDIFLEENNIKIITEIEDFIWVEKFFEDKNIEIKKAEIEYIPDNRTEITDFDKALKFIKMIDAFEEDEDVEFTATNEEIDDELVKEVLEFIQKNTFKT